MSMTLRLISGSAAIFLLASGVSASAQSLVPSSSTAAPSQNIPPPSPAVQALRQQQAALGEQMAALIQQGATGQQIDTWRQQNAPAISSCSQSAQNLSANTSTTISFPAEISVPAGASPDLLNLLNTQAYLASAAATLHLQLQSTQGSSQQEAQLFHQQYAAELNSVTQSAIALSNQNVQNPLAVPDGPVIPPNASVQLKAFLILRYHLMKERA